LLRNKHWFPFRNKRLEHDEHVYSAMDSHSKGHANDLYVQDVRPSDAACTDGSDAVPESSVHAEWSGRLKTSLSLSNDDMEIRIQQALYLWNRNGDFLDRLLASNMFHSIRNELRSLGLSTENLPYGFR
jgi:hypothetical protein